MPYKLQYSVTPEAVTNSMVDLIALVESDVQKVASFADSDDRICIWWEAECWVSEVMGPTEFVLWDPRTPFPDGVHLLWCKASSTP